MPDTRELLVELRDVSKHYNALRPLRVQQLELRAGQSLALLGLDAAAAEVLVSVITGATLPDSGEARVLGEATSAITTGEQWLKWLEHFGLLSARSVVVDELTAEQNLAIPYSLEVEDMPPMVRSRVHQLASELGLSAQELSTPIAHLPPLTRARVRLGRALALSPRLLLAEHPNAMLSADDTPVFAADLSRIIGGRDLAVLVITADATFAAAVAQDVLTLQPATGAIKRSGGWRRWFG
jgi:ABC-type lipoprotein export system ATPase subunit